ncbi:hypothetical protein ElyMa_002549300 [Elysia marginata]|uniref:AP2/ERF domain-containing protein n=1 Tax=Elysia marginata TaxID=1093978 RepID=A0AAV4GX85_9GAST|nr:hypothetical protein ElyMa_002549300 [Elysia marginata]
MFDGGNLPPTEHVRVAADCANLAPAASCAGSEKRTGRATGYWPIGLSSRKRDGLNDRRWSLQWSTGRLYKGSFSSTSQPAQDANTRVVYLCTSRTVPTHNYAPVQSLKHNKELMNRSH